MIMLPVKTVSWSYLVITAYNRYRNTSETYSMSCLVAMQTIHYYGKWYSGYDMNIRMVIIVPELLTYSTIRNLFHNK